jgi:outer membrane protein assembly factor BamB/tetratricopeptide (TPR) repeat protein
MALKGDLTSVGLADVFQMLALNQKVGILSIFDEDHWRALYFDRRGVTLYYNEHVFLDRLLDGLMQRGLVEPQTLDVFRRENSGDPIATVESLLGGGILPEADFLAAFRDQMEEDVYDLFLWENVHWEFLEGVDSIEDHEGVINENFFLSPDSLVMEAARRLDEWAFLREQVPGPLEIYEPDPGIDTTVISGMDDFSLSLLDYVDGRRNVGRIVELSGVTPFHVYKALSQLVGEGLIYPVPDDRLLDTANDCIAEGRLEDGIYLLEKAIEIGAGIPDAYVLAARSHESEGDYAKAAYYYKCYSNHAVENGDLVEAEGTLSHCCDLLPTDLDARERWLRILAPMENPPADPQDVGRKLIDIYLDLDETDRARQILEILLEVDPNDIELKKSLVTIHSKAGDQKRVMELYESIAEDLVAQKDPIGAVRYLQKILMLDRTRKDISDRVKQLYVMDERHRSRRRSVALAIAGVFCFGALGFFYYLYEQHVRTAFLALDVETQMTEHNFDGAIAMYRGFQEKYPLSMIGGEVDDAIGRIESEKRKYEAAREMAEAARRAKAKQHRTSYRRIYAQYESGSREHSSGASFDLEAAIKQLEEVDRLIRKAGEDEDLEFAREMRIEEALREQRNYLIKAVTLDGRLEKALEAGDFAKARELALQMHEQYPYANVTQSTLVPFQISSEPHGAELWTSEGPVLDAAGETVKTPAFVRVPFERPVRFELRLEGYEALGASVLGKNPSPLQLVLPVKPERLLDLGVSTVTGIGVGKNLGLVGLKEGRLRAFALDSGETAFEIRLRGLDEVHGTPAVFDKVGIFATSSGWLRAVDLAKGKLLWDVEIPGGVKTQLVPLESGIVLGTGSGELRFYPTDRGEPLWTVKVGGTALNDPIVYRSRVWIANREGRFLCVAEDDGEILERWDLPGGLRSTPIVLPTRHAVYLAADGKLYSFDLEKRALAWQKPVRSLRASSKVLLAQGWLFVVDDEGTVSRVDPATGESLASRQLPNPSWGASFASDQRLYVCTRNQKEPPQIVALRVPDLEIRWSYELASQSVAQPVLSGRSLLMEIGGKVHVLR